MQANCKGLTGVAPLERGGYYGCQTWQNQVAWALGGVLLPLGVILAVLGTSRFTACDFEYANCETANWYQSSDLCYTQFVEECHGLRWAYVIVTSAVLILGALCSLCYCCCCTPRYEADVQPLVVAASGSFMRVLPNGVYQRLPLATIEEQPFIGEGYMCADGDSTWVTNCLPMTATWPATPLAASTAPLLQPLVEHPVGSAYGGRSIGTALPQPRHAWSNAGCAALSGGGFTTTTVINPLQVPQPLLARHSMSPPVSPYSVHKPKM